MKAMRFYEKEKPLVMEDIPIPEIGPDDVLLDVKACGICGSDIHILEGVTPTGFLPITMGHEMSGVIAELGANVKGWKAGDRVCVDCIISCGTCFNCLTGRESVCFTKRLLGIHENGGMAEYCCVPARNLIALPDNVPFDIGAIITDAVATPYHALVKIGQFKLGQSIAVFGVGGLGCQAVQLAALAGASKIIAVDVNPAVLERAKKLGADHVINSKETDPVTAILELTGGTGVDLAGEFIGLAKTIDQAVRCVRIGGRAVLVGLGPENICTLPPTLFVRQEREILGSYSFERTEIQTLVQLASSGRLDLSGAVTERLPLEEANTALDHLWKKIGNPIRIVITQD